MTILDITLFFMMIWLLKVLISISQDKELRGVLVRM